MSFSEENLLRCTSVPSNLLIEKNPYTHFQKFGVITRLEVIPDKSEILLGFQKMTSALNAMSKGNFFEGKTFTIDLESTPSRFGVKKKRVRKIAKLPEEMDEEIKAELMAMGGYSNSDLEMSELLKKKKRIEKKLKRTLNSENENPVKVKKSHFNEDTMNPEQRDLLDIISKPGATEEEKFKILDARDKLLRLLGNKRKKISITKKNIGTCPDMCPEKERLMRVYQHQVSFFELDQESKSMNHSLAVKQYSRSSADQESPLPHELRNVGVLKMTMGYLLHEIMDLCNNPQTNLGDWYHFSWDRTRSLRKDITQQDLCCAGSVEILEQCTRFHIHCSARLVAEEATVFDQKINTENLTKCLQTLKYFYDDLALKNQSCLNEPEFRGYIILLNLNNGVIMWEVQHLRPEVQKSPEVRFALSVCSALDKNNYVKFFKLVRSATYLNACILLRYFLQVRIKALEIKLRSSVAPRTQTVPIQELQEMLGFEDFETTVDFFYYYGLSTNEDKSSVVLDKQYFSIPDVPFTFGRAVNLIESKVDRLVGEIISGQKLPPKKFESHIPENSFDNAGYLIKSKLPVSLETIVSKKSASIINLTNERSRSNSPLIYEAPNKMELSKSIFDKGSSGNSQTASIFGGSFKKNDSFTKSTEIPEIFTLKNIDNKNDNSMDVFKKVQTSIFDTNKEEKLNAFANSFFSNNLSKPSTSTTFLQQPKIPEEPQLLKNISPGGFSFNFTDKTLIAKEKDLKLKQEQEMKEKIQKQKALEESERLKQEALKKEEEIQAKILLEKSRLLELENKRKRDLQIKMEEEIKRKQMDLERRLELEKKEKLKLEKQQAFEKLKRQQMEELRLKEKREKEELLVSEQIKNEVKILLASILKSVEDEFRKEKLGDLKYKCLCRWVIVRWRRKVASNKRKRKAIDESPMWVIAKTLRETAKDFYMGAQDITLNLMKRYKLGLPINIKTSFEPNVNKLNLFELTYSELCKNLQLLNDIYWKVNIVAYKNSKLFGLIDDVLNTCVSWENNVHVEQHKVGVHEVNYCLEKSTRILKTSESNGLIFITDLLNDIILKVIADTVEYVTEEQAVPISIIVQDSLIDEELLDDLVDTKRISNYKIFISTFLEIDLFTSINHALKFLALNVKPPPDLQLNLLQNLLVENMGSDLWHRILSFAKWNVPYYKCLLSPNTVIALYNEALGRIKNLLFTSDCYNQPDFSPVFKNLLSSQSPQYLPCDYKFFPEFWRDPMYKGLINRKIDLLKLPPYKLTWPPKDQLELEKDILNYCGNNFKNPKQVFYRVMAAILRNKQPDFVDKISWLDIVKVLSNEKIKEIDYKISVEFFDTELFNELFVVYELNALKAFQTEAWFYLSNPLIVDEINKMFKEKEENVNVTEEKDDEYDINLDDTLRKIAENWDFDDVISEKKVEMDKFNMLMEDLQESISLQKRTSSKFQSLLEKALEIN